MQTIVFNGPKVVERAPATTPLRIVKDSPSKGLALDKTWAKSGTVSSQVKKIGQTMYDGIKSAGRVIKSIPTKIGVYFFQKSMDPLLLKAHKKTLKLAKDHPSSLIKPELVLDNSPAVRSRQVEGVKKIQDLKVEHETVMSEHAKVMQQFEKEMTLSEKKTSEAKIIHEKQHKKFLADQAASVAKRKALEARLKALQEKIDTFTEISSESMIKIKNKLKEFKETSSEKFDDAKLAQLEKFEQQTNKNVAGDRQRKEAAAKTITEKALQNADFVKTSQGNLSRLEARYSKEGRFDANILQELVKDSNSVPKADEVNLSYRQVVVERNALNASIKAVLPHSSVKDFSSEKAALLFANPVAKIKFLEQLEKFENAVAQYKNKVMASDMAGFTIKMGAQL